MPLLDRSTAPDSVSYRRVSANSFSLFLSAPHTPEIGTADSRRWTGEHPRLSAFIGGFKCLKRGNIQLKYRPVLPILGAFFIGGKK